MNIFVFGSNTQGRHGKGAALTARLNHGAIYGKATGIQGNSYAIITKELRPSHQKITYQQIQQSVEDFLIYAEDHPEHIFHITHIGCGLAGFDWDTQIKPLFQHKPSNCIFI